MSFLTSETDNKILDTVFIETKFNTLLEEMHFLIVLLGVSLIKNDTMYMHADCWVDHPLWYNMIHNDCSILGKPCLNNGTVSVE